MNVTLQDCLACLAFVDHSFPDPVSCRDTVSLESLKEALEVLMSSDLWLGFATAWDEPFPKTLGKPAC